MFQRPALSDRHFSSGVSVLLWERCRAPQAAQLQPEGVRGRGRTRPPCAVERVEESTGSEGGSEGAACLRALVGEMGGSERLSGSSVGRSVAWEARGITRVQWRHVLQALGVLQVYGTRRIGLRLGTPSRPWITHTGSA